MEKGGGTPLVKLRGGGEHCVQAVTDMLSKGVGDKVKPPGHTRATAGGRRGQPRATRTGAGDRDGWG
jgi:hypothetical protein